MNVQEKDKQDLQLEIARLKERLAEAEETIDAIRSGEIDAVVVSGDRGDQIYTLKGAEHTYRILIETMNEGAVTTTSDGLILYANRRFSEMLGTRPEEIMGKSFFQFMRPTEADTLQDLLERGAEGEAKGETFLRREDGACLPVLVSLKPLPVNDQKILCAILTDLSDQKAAEEKLRAYANVLEIKNQELQDFAYVASHDLQEPLRKIQAFSGLLKRAAVEGVGEKGQDYLNRMENSVRRMQALIQGLLAYSRLTTRAKPFSLVNLQETAEEALSNLEVLVNEKGGEVEIHDLPSIYAERHQMLQLFQNLIGNALKFSKNDERPVVKVRAELTEDKKWRRILVQDNGIGFEEKYLDRIFVPFQRLHGRFEYEGTGIGLAICKRIAEHHGGQLSAKSEPGEGATFVVTLPVEQEKEAGFNA